MRDTIPSDFDDADLVARARAGDDTAFGELMRRHQQPALRVASVISGSIDDADDIVQDAFVKVHRQLGSYRARGSVRSWMLRVVANEAKNHVRSRVRRRRRDTREERAALRIAESADAVVEQQGEHEALAEALATLPVADREVLGCRYVTGLDEAETATVLGVARGTVKSRTSRALGRLRAALAEQDAGVDHD